MDFKMNISVGLRELEIQALVKKCVILEYLLQKSPGTIISSESPILANAIDSDCSFETIRLLLKAGAGRDIAGCSGKTANYSLNNYNLGGDISLPKIIL